MPARKPNHPQTRSLLLAAVIAIAAPILSGHASLQPPQQATQKADTPEPQAETDPAGPPFEVATIRPANRDDGHQSFGIQITASGGFNVSATTLNSLVWYAYAGMPGEGRVDGGPPWANTENFDINAKIDDASMAGWDKLSDRERRDRVKPMVRALLVERFHLKLRTEMRETKVYAVVQAKGGIKMKPADAPPANAEPLQDRLRAERDKMPDKAPPGGMMMTGDMWRGTAVQISSMGGQIAASSRLDSIVVDQTGLPGYYDFSMKVSYDKDGPTFAEQVEDQLGLKLVPKKIQMKTYVIESAEKPSLDGAELTQPVPQNLMVSNRGNNRA